MGLKNLRIGLIYRLGTFQADNLHPRPLVVNFPDIKERWAIWGKKGSIKRTKESPIWIQEDLPKQLREDNRLLHRIAKVANLFPDRYEGVRIKDYGIFINGTKFGPGKLQNLPEELRPERVYSPRSDKAIAFFTKHSPLSNHYVCPFEFDGRRFNWVEQFLAHQKATYAGNDDLAQRSLDSEDPAEPKAILNQIKSIQNSDWQSKVQKIIYAAASAKFSQNEHLGNFLVETHPLRIGEASKDTFWDIGLTLESEHALDVRRWPLQGNLLGLTLEKVRDEIIQHFMYED